jgi:hypothetical protein
MSEEQRKEFLEMRKQFLELIETIKLEIKAFQVIEGENIAVKVCLN